MIHIAGNAEDAQRDAATISTWRPAVPRRSLSRRGASSHTDKGYQA